MGNFYVQQLIIVLYNAKKIFKDSSEERMDTSTPPDTSWSTHHPHDTVGTLDTDVATPLLTGSYLATITSYDRGGHGVISEGEILPRGRHRGRISRHGTGLGGTRESTGSVSVESCGRCCRGRGPSNRDGWCGWGCGHGKNISTSPFENSLGTWGKKNYLHFNMFTGLLQVQHSTVKQHDSIRAFFIFLHRWSLGSPGKGD